MTSPLAMLIGAAVRCVKCGRAGECGCWVKCACGWMKERGEPACTRCSAVEWTKAGRSEYEGRIGGTTIRVYKDGIHWRSAVRLPGPLPEIDTNERCATAKASQFWAVVAAWRLGAKSPPPTPIALSPAPSSDTEGR
jgi:hypothetical protein